MKYKKRIARLNARIKYWEEFNRRNPVLAKFFANKPGSLNK